VDDPPGDDELAGIEVELPPLGWPVPGVTPGATEPGREAVPVVDGPGWEDEAESLANATSVAEISTIPASPPATRTPEPLSTALALTRCRSGLGSADASDG